MSPQDVSRLLAEWGRGDRSALDKLFPLVHAELRRIAGNQTSRWHRLRSGQPAAIYFWYRQSPHPFEVSNAGEVTENTPARNVSGMVTVTLDTLGRLRSFYAVPPQRGSSPGDAAAPDWSTLFAESGLDLAKFQPAESTWTPPHESTARAAWDGTYPDQPESRIHVEAALYDGKPVYFEIIDAWDQPPQQQTSIGSLNQRFLIVFLIAIFIIAMVGSAFLAWRNLRLGRGDRKGAFRLAAFVFVALLLRWLFTGHHVPAVGEALNFISSVQRVLFWAFFFWVVYVAFEPFVRRRWPGRIISWSRVLAGNFRDPLVGRDILIGAVFGVGYILVKPYLAELIPQWLGYPARAPWFDFPATQLLGIRSFAGGLILQIFAALMLSFILLFFLLLLNIILRKDRLAALVAWSLVTLILSLALGTLAGVPFASVNAFLVVWALYRYGLLALISTLFFQHLLVFFPITSEFSAWYAGDFVPALIVSLALALYAFYTSLAGQPLFRGLLKE